MIKEYFRKFWHHWWILLKDTPYRISLFSGLLLTFLAFSTTQFAAVYNDSQIYISVGDLILDNIPTFNLHFLYTWGTYIIFVFIFAYPILFKPEILPFVLKTGSILGFLRAGFIMLTNLGAPATSFYAGKLIGDNIFSHFMFKNDLFFSGHTAYPFLAYLLFRNYNKHLAYFMLAASLVEAITVLLMHIHYSIDVFAAFFVAYGTYALSDKIFNKLNLRFRSKIRLYGWAAVEKLKKLTKK